MYLALVFITASLALLANALWPLILLPVVIVIVRRAVIDREERYLTTKFGEEYLRYKARVRPGCSTIAGSVALSLINNGTIVTHQLDPPIGSINRTCGTGRVRSHRSLGGLTPA